MFTSLGNSRAGGFLKWSAAHTPASNDDDSPDSGNSVAVRLPDLDEAMIVPAAQYRPWQMPGVGTAF